MPDLHEMAETLRNLYGEPQSSVDYLLAHPEKIPSPPRIVSSDEIMARSLDAFSDWIAAPMEKL
jgi:hypothetical protein